MEVKFTSTTKQNLNSLPIVNGQLIAVSDIDEYYYDLGSERRSVSGVVINSSLPASGQTNKLYIVSSNNEIQLYVYDGSQFHTTGSGNINDFSASSSTTYSSTKIESLIETKQDDLMGRTYSGNIDQLIGVNKAYWIDISSLPSGDTGSLPFNSGYFHLICSSVTPAGTTQIAIPQYTSTASYGYMYYRMYTNSAWQAWRRVHDVTDSWKIRKTSETVTLTVAAGSSVSLRIPVPANYSNSVIPLYARSSDKTRTLAIVNMYSTNNNITVMFRNVGNAAYSNESMTLEVTYAYTY